MPRKRGDPEAESGPREAKEGRWNPLCAACARACKQYACVIVVWCPIRVPIGT